MDQIPDAQTNWPHEREHPRVPYASRATFKTRVGKPMEGLVRDLSEGGAYVATSARMPVGTELFMYIPLAIRNKTSLCIVTGRVVRLANSGEIEGFAVRFDPAPGESTLRNLREYVTLQASAR
ncbi:MAG: PilZ domain-containing protein [Pseudomonadota bacterium]